MITRFLPRSSPFSPPLGPDFCSGWSVVNLLSRGLCKTEPEGGCIPRQLRCKNEKWAFFKEKKKREEGAIQKYVRHQTKLDVVLVNPATRNHSLLPVSPIKYPCRSQTLCEVIVYGFGYNSVADDYYVVRIAQFRPQFKSEVQIYSLKLNQWRRSNDFPYRLTSTTHAVFVDGALNWLVGSRHFKDVKIASFDLATEEYRLIEPPGYPTSVYKGILRVVGRKLCIQCNYSNRHFTIWVKENYGAQWTKLFSLVHSVDIVSLKPLAFSNDGKKLLLEVEGELVWYDLQLKVMNIITNPDIPECWKADVSLESLVKG
ncbi:hypothetical protein AgCh_010016 [Apium graveolens]